MVLGFRECAQSSKDYFGGSMGRDFMGKGSFYKEARLTLACTLGTLTRVEFH